MFLLTIIKLANHNHLKPLLVIGQDLGKTKANVHMSIPLVRC